MKKLNTINLIFRALSTIGGSGFPLYLLPLFLSGQKDAISIPNANCPRKTTKRIQQFVSSLLFISLIISCISNNSVKKHTNNKQNKPTITVIDTDFSKGRLTLEHKITLNDLEKFHGHLCDGLIVGFLGIKEGLDVLYPNGIVDRTNTRIVSKSSPCLTDVAVYITGGRYQYNSFYVDNTITNGFYIIQRKDNGKTVSVTLNNGVKPQQIDKLGAKAIKGELPACDLDKLKQLEDEFSEKLLTENPKTNFTVKEITNFKWQPVLKNDYTKTDVLNKNKEKCNK